MTTLIYDNTFNGFLSAIFDVYEYKLSAPHIVPAHRPQITLFGDSRNVESCDQKAQRVWRGLGRVVPVGRQDIYNTFLSELPGIENMLLSYIQYAFSSGNIRKDYSNPAVLYVAETSKKVHREKHRMEAFVRFRRTGDDLYFATIEPDFNVLPLIADHFECRYADQKWLIYDLKRSYGIYYDLNSTTTVQIDFANNVEDLNRISHLLNTEEPEYEQLWRNYFKSVNIESRRNLKLHKQHMPLRYWKYLTEKQ